MIIIERAYRLGAVIERHLCGLRIDVGLYHEGNLTQTVEIDGIGEEGGILEDSYQLPVPADAQFQEVVAIAVAEQRHVLVVVVGVNHYIHSERPAAQVAHT